MYRNGPWFLTVVLIFCWVCLLVLTGVFVEYLEFSTCKILSSPNRGNFTSFLPDASAGNFHGKTSSLISIHWVSFSNTLNIPVIMCLHFFLCSFPTFIFIITILFHLFIQKILVESVLCARSWDTLVASCHLLGATYIYSFLRE